ncbi:GNAT family N-acetyltransferase [soil metagenome]
MHIDPILLDLPAELRGEKVLVRPYRPGDGAALQEAMNESYEHLSRTMPWAKPDATVDETEATVRRFDAKYRLREDMVMGIWHIETGRYLGGTGLHRIDWEVRKFEIGYWIRVSEEAKGYVTEAANLLCELAFGQLEANRVFIRCAADNVRSAAVPRRLGFEHEGTLKNDGIRDGGEELFDIHVFGMTREAWMARSV